LNQIVFKTAAAGLNQTVCSLRHIP
jgi:hypothetical protein